MKERLCTHLIENLEPDVRVLAGPVALRRYPDDGEPGEPGFAILLRQSGHLIARAAVCDSYAKSRATDDNQKTWELGDVLELFVQLADHEDYYELHVTPEGRKLQYRLLDYRIPHGPPWDVNFCDCGLEVKSLVQDGFWFAEMRVALSKIEATTAAELRFAICRYNYGPSGEPELSSFPALDTTHGFHNPPRWQRVMLKA